MTYRIPFALRCERKARKSRVKCKLPYCHRSTNSSKELGMCRTCYRRINKLQRGRSELRIEC